MAVNKTDTVPQAIQPFAWHGVELSVNGSSNARGDCPFCGKEGKFYVSTENGKYDCKVCAKAGNAYTFMRTLHESASEYLDDSYESLRMDRGLLSPDTLLAWGVRASPLTGEWVVPGHGVDGKLNQLYRYVEIKGKNRLLCTQGVEHQLFGTQKGLYDPKKPTLYLCESVWDAMALWEMLGKVKYREDGRLARTSNVEASLLSGANVVSTPGANVFKESWLELFAGKRVVFVSQNDHPKRDEEKGIDRPSASLTGIRKIVGMIPASTRLPKSCEYLCWGDDPEVGWTKNLDSGYDLRDCLNEAETLQDRVARLGGMLESIRPVPKSWSGNSGLAPISASQGPLMDLLECESFEELEGYWRKAFDWTFGYSKTLSAMLSCVFAVPILGDQLWMRVISPPSSGKTALCEALTANLEFVIQVSNMRGFHSGYKTDKEGQEDHSLIPLINGKAMVTKDGDTIIQSPNRQQIMAEARELFDSVSSTNFRNGINRKYGDIRFSWILCGTKELRVLDESEQSLGGRFLDCILIDRMSLGTERRINKRKVASAFDLMFIDPASVKGKTNEGPAMTDAKRATGGYIEFIRRNSTQILSRIEKNRKKCAEALESCEVMGHFVARMRARPSQKMTEEAQHEMPFRLSSQLTRMATSMAVVMNKDYIDGEVMKRVRSIALDTARGKVLNLVKYMRENDGREMTDQGLASVMGERHDSMRGLLAFLRKIGVVELYDANSGKSSSAVKNRHRLTAHMRGLYDEVMGE